MLNPLRHWRIRFWSTWSRYERQGAIAAAVVVVLALVVAVLIRCGAGVP